MAFGGGKLLRGGRTAAASSALALVGLLLLAGLAGASLPTGAAASSLRPASAPGEPMAHARPVGGRADRVVGPGGGLGTIGSEPAPTNLTVGSARWTEAVATGSTPSSSGVAMAYDAAALELVAFGGAQKASGHAEIYSNRTWTYQGGSWSVLCATGDGAGGCPVAPAPRMGALMAYDAATNAIYLTGGRGPAPGTGNRTNGTTVSFSDLWSFADLTWTNLTATAAPPPGLADGAMTYDPALGGLLAFTDQGKTYTFVDGSWTEITTSVAPTSRSYPQLFYDAGPQNGSGAVVLYGGISPNDRTLNDTWVFSEGNWTRVETESAPTRAGLSGARTFLEMPGAAAFDARRGIAVLFDPGNLGGNTTWTYQNGSWMNLTPTLSVTPGNNLGATMIYDPSDEAVAVVTEGHLNGPVGVWHLSSPLQIEVGVNSATLDLGMSHGWSLALAGGLLPYATQLTSGPASCSLANGLSSSPRLGCDPEGTGSLNLSVVFSDGAGRTANVSYHLDVNPDPVLTIPSIEPNPTSVGVPVRFNASLRLGTPPYGQFDWSFDGQNVSGGLALNATFASIGSHAVELVAFDALGYRVSAEVHVLVHAGPSAELTSNRSSTDVGVPVAFDALVAGGTGDLSCSWNFGDGTGSQACATTHAFRFAGNLTVRFWTNDSIGAVGESNLSLEVAPMLGAHLVLNSTSLDVGRSLAMSVEESGGLAPYTVRWWFGDGGTAAGPDVSHSYGVPGQYAAEAEVTDAVGASIITESVVNVVAAPGTPPHVAAPGNGSGHGSGSLVVPYGRGPSAGPGPAVPWLAVEGALALAAALAWMRWDLRTRRPGRGPR